MSLADAALSVGEFLLKHHGIVEDAAKAIAAGTPEEIVRQAIRQAQTKISDDAIAEELRAAEARRQR